MAIYAKYILVPIKFPSIACNIKLLYESAKTTIHYVSACWIYLIYGWATCIRAVCTLEKDVNNVFDEKELHVHFVYIFQYFSRDFTYRNEQILVKFSEAHQEGEP